MKIRKIGIILILILSFFSIDNVSAMSCADIDKEIKNYELINSELSKYNCEDVENEDTVSKCNKLGLKKNASLSEIYRISENEKECSSKADEAKKIIDANKDKCGVVLGDFVNNILNYFMGIFYIAGPLLLILFGTLDFSKATISGENGALKKASNRFLKRILALIFLFLAPAITRVIISLNTSGYYLSGDVYSCEYKNIVAKKNVEVTYIARPEKSNSSSSSDDYSDGSSGERVTGDFTKWKQYEGSWKNITIGCGAIRRCGCLLTATAIQVANSGTAKSKSFNPGTFVNAIKSHGGVTSGGGFTWTGWSTVAPKFKFVGKETATGSLNNKAKQFKKWLEQGYYPVVEVKKGCNGQHWVAVLSVSGNKIQIADPGGDVTTLPGKYSCFSTHNHEVGLFKVD